MALSLSLAIGFQNTVADTVEQVYLSPASGQGTLITALTAANNTGSSDTFKAYIYDSAGTETGVAQPQTIVVRDDFSPVSGIVNHVIPAGGSLRVESSTASGIEFTLTGINQ